MPGHESDERRAYEHQALKDWYNKKPERKRDYDDDTYDEESEALHDYEMRKWERQVPKRDRGYW